jgi:hypothetical protein
MVKVMNFIGIEPLSRRNSTIMQQPMYGQPMIRPYMCMGSSSSLLSCLLCTIPRRWASL